MAEFCKDCFQRNLQTDPNETIILSEDEDFCEGCGKFARYVLKTFPAPARVFDHHTTADIEGAIELLMHVHKYYNDPNTDQEVERREKWREKSSNG